jgi:hypothetical protein
MTSLVVFLQGFSVAGAFVAGLLFLRFWQESRDRLFVHFAVGFWLIGASWAALAIFSPTEEARPYVYGLRLVAFMLIISGIVVKNQSRRDR